MKRKCLIPALSMAIVIVVTCSLWADPAFQQLPLNTQSVSLNFADDFAGHFNSPIVYVKWWGFYNGAPEHPATQFTIAFYSDVPPSASNPFGHPGDLLSTQKVNLGTLAPGSGTFNVAGSPFPFIGEYNAELKLGTEFHAERDTVYWISISGRANDPTLWLWSPRNPGLFDPYASTAPAVVPGEYQTGSNYHFQSDAVTRSLDGVYATRPNVDMGFELYTTHYVPEPTIIAILGVMLLTCKRQRRI